jgi:hypothetical protein
MKRKEYKEETPEPKDYAVSDYSEDLCQISSAAAGRDDDDLFYWQEVPKEPTPKGPNGGGDPDDGGDGDNGVDPGDDDPFGMHPLCCAACCHSISDFNALVEECFQAMEVMRQRMEELEHVVDDDYNFFNQNVRKDFRMVGNMKKKWCMDYGNFHLIVRVSALRILVKYD